MARFFDMKSSRSFGTLSQMKAEFNRRNVTTRVSESFNHSWDFVQVTKWKPFFVPRTLHILHEHYNCMAVLASMAIHTCTQTAVLHLNWNALMSRVSGVDLRNLVTIHATFLIIVNLVLQAVLVFFTFMGMPAT